MQSEHYGKGEAHVDGLASLLARSPVGHFAHYAQRLGIEQWVYGFHYLGVGDATILSHNNVIGYANTAYDTLLSIIASAPHGTARLGCLHDAETLLLEDFALLPLYTHGVAWEIREGLTGLCRDARGWFSFAEMEELPVGE